jgi:hypothetical protein
MPRPFLSFAELQQCLRDWPWESKVVQLFSGLTANQKILGTSRRPVLAVFLPLRVPESRRRVVPTAPSGGARYPALSATPPGAALG